MYSFESKRCINFGVLFFRLSDWNHCAFFERAALSLLVT